MGIDVYLEWNGQTEAEKEARYSGGACTSGSKGYLRESYHGNPYATRVLLPEAFSGEPTSIPAATLNERLGDTLTCALVRDLMLYQQGDPAHFGPAGSNIEDAIQKLAPTLIGRLKAASKQSRDWYADYPDHIVMTARLQVGLASKYGWLPDFAQTFVDFVQLVKKLEDEGKEPRITVSA